MMCCPPQFECVNSNYSAPACSDPQNTTDPVCNQCIRYTIYDYPRNGPLDGDYTWKEENKRCLLREGLDFAVFANQISDAEDADVNEDYKWLGNIVVEGLCGVDWPVNPYVLWPDVSVSDTQKDIIFGG